MKLLHKLLFGYIVIVILIGTSSSYLILKTVDKNSAALSVYREREITSFVAIF